MKNQIVNNQIDYLMVKFSSWGMFKDLTPSEKETIRQDLITLASTSILEAQKAMINATQNIIQ